MTKTITDIIEIRNEISKCAKMRELSAEKNPTVETYKNLILCNGPLLTKIARISAEALRAFPPSSFPALKANLQEIRDVASSAEQARTYEKRKERLRDDFGVIIEALVNIDDISSRDIVDQVPSTEEEDVTSIASDIRNLGGMNDTWPCPAFHLDHMGLFALACRLSRKWGLFLSIDAGDYDDTNDGLVGKNGVLNAAPYLHTNSFNGEGWRAQYLLFDTKEDMERCYWATVGPDGPTETNDYDGNATIYAVTCSPAGQLLNENT